MRRGGLGWPLIGGAGNAEPSRKAVQLVDIVRQKVAPFEPVPVPDGVIDIDHVRVPAQLHQKGEPLYPRAGSGRNRSKISNTAPARNRRSRLARSEMTRIPAPMRCAAAVLTLAKVPPTARRASSMVKAGQRLAARGGSTGLLVRMAAAQSPSSTVCAACLAPLMDAYRTQCALPQEYGIKSVIP